jgi:hypothetical protein
MDRQAIYDAILKADAAGDAEAVKVLGNHLKELDAGNGGALEVDVTGGQDIATEAANRPMLTPNPDYGYQLGLIDQRPTSQIQGFVEGLVKPIDAAGDFAEAGVRAIGGGGMIDAMNNFGADYLGTARNSAEGDAYRQRQLDQSAYQSSSVGKFIGEVVGTLPTAALRGGLLAQGAAGGALLSNNRDIMGVAKDAALGAAGAHIGGAMVNRAAGIIAPRVQPAVRRLIDAGVPLTPGQILGQGGRAGRAVKQLEDATGNLPVIGSSVRALRRDGVEALNRAQTNRALAPIGETLPDNVAVGHDAVAYAGDQLSAAYRQVLPNLNGTIDRNFASRLSTLRQRANLPPEYETQLDQIMTEASNAFTGNGANGQYTGRTLRDASERLGDIAKGWRGSDDPYLRMAGDLADDTRAQLHALARRQNPGSAQRLRAIDRGYASLVRTEKAAAGTVDGIFTGPQLRTAVRGADSSVRKRASARGQALDQQLAVDASAVMPSTVGEGGSNAINGLGMLGALGVGVMGGSTGAMTLAAGGAASLAAFTRPGQRIAQTLLTRKAGPTSTSLANLMRAGASRSAPLLAPLPSYLANLTPGTGQ